MDTVITNTTIVTGGLDGAIRYDAALAVVDSHIAAIGNRPTYRRSFPPPRYWTAGARPSFRD